MLLSKTVHITTLQLYISCSRGICCKGTGQKRNERIMRRPSSGRVAQRREGRKELRKQAGARRIQYNAKEIAKA